MSSHASVLLDQRKPAINGVQPRAVVLLRLVDLFEHPGMLLKNFIGAALVDAHRGHFMLKLGHVHRSCRDHAPCEASRASGCW